MTDYRTTPEGLFAYDYPRAAMTTDQVIFGFDGIQLHVLLVERGIEPYKGRWAFPGGFLKMDETLDECARRELQEETSLENIYMEQFAVFSDVERDPRGRVISTAYYALVPMQEVKGGDDAADARWYAINEVPQLAFDHDKILRIALRHLREDLHFRPVGFSLLPQKFSMPQLQRLYEAILDIHFDRRNFTKKMLSTGILNDLHETDPNAKHRAGFLYSFNKEAYDQMKHDGTLKLEF